MGVLLHETPSRVADPVRVVNEFAINVATANGTGSQTSNNVILRTLFKMGIPITGKNLFPSNIQGLPTWYLIRLSRDGYLARREGTEVMVCMNGRTVAEDMATVLPGGIILYDDSLPIADHRKDVTYYTMPVKELVKAADISAQLREYVANMVYVGVLAWILRLEMAEIESALDWNFSGKRKAVQLNMGMVQRAYDWAAENLTKQDPYLVERMEGFTEDKVLIDGNTAAALGATFGGVNLVSWYPITPSSSVADALNKYLPKLRMDPDTGLATYAVIQAEDELAAIGMAIGAGWAGARAMTATSGPGISLMSEFAGMAYFAEVPTVIWDIQRMGPSTGLPTRTSQGDLLAAYYLGHGDTRHVVLLPCNPKECFEFGHLAFDLADSFQAPIFVLSDLDLGMNLWISEPFDYPEAPIDRGKVLSAADLRELEGKWGRYRDVDGDGITYRTLPGNEHPLAGYFTRGTGHDENARYSERPDVWERNLDRLHRKFETIRNQVPGPVVDEAADAQIAIISFGSNDPAVAEARDRLRKDGIETSYLRLRALPVSQTVREFIQRYPQVFVVENNYDGQMQKILVTEAPTAAAHLISVARCDGMPLSARWIKETIQSRL